MTNMNNQNNKRTCDCPDPPGGKLTCDADQLAICQIKNGKIDAACISIPLNISNKSPMNVFNWILSKITNRDRDIDATLFDKDYRILKRGFYEGDGYQVRFVLPLNYQNMLNGRI